jgi:hypothetical protein
MPGQFSGELRAPIRNARNLLRAVQRLHRRVLPAGNGGFCCGIWRPSAQGWNRPGIPAGSGLCWGAWGSGSKPCLTRRR